MSALAINVFLVRADSLPLVEYRIVGADHRESVSGIVADVKNPAVIIHIGVKAGRSTFASEAKCQIAEDVDVVLFARYFLVGFQTISVLRVQKVPRNFYLSSRNDNYC